MTLLSSSDWAFSDDPGSGTAGTVFDAAKMALLKASIELLIHSTTNPSITPEDIIDEVKTARGASANLNARLNAIDTTIVGLQVGLKRTRLDVNFTDITRQGVGPFDFHVTTIPANTLAANGASVHIRSVLVNDGGTGVRTIKLWVGSQSFTLSGSNAASIAQSYTITLVRSGSSLMIGVADMQLHASTAGVVVISLTSLDFGVDNSIKLTLEGAGAGDGATQKFWLVEFEG